MPEVVNSLNVVIFTVRSNATAIAFTCGFAIVHTSAAHSGHNTEGHIMSSTPKKIVAGLYEYRGYNIERRQGEWYVAPIGEHATDVTATLTDAIILIDNIEG